MSVLIKGMEMPKCCAECDIEGHYENYNGDEYGFFCPFGYKAYTEKTRDAKRLDNCPLVPDADVRPVVRGHWIDGVCSNCGFFTDVVMSRFFSYCPNCGADMREPPKEETE